MRHRLLLVDDEDTILGAISEYLTGRGYDVDVAREREEAEALLTVRRYAAVITDVRMTGPHGAEGLEILSYARQHDPTSVRILLSGNAPPSLMAAGREYGADVLLTKPIPLAELARILEERIESRR